MRPTKEYLCKLLSETVQKFENFTPPDLDLSAAEITYIPTRKNPWMGIERGLIGQREMMVYKVKESPKVRSNCKAYNEFYKINGRLVKTVYVTAGYPVCSCRYAYYEGDWRYMFPFRYDEKDYGARIFACCTAIGTTEYIAEEYRIDGNQIVYTCYSAPKDGKAEYYHINYVPTGKFPVICEEDGFFNVDTLEYTVRSSRTWWDDVKDEPKCERK